jgi:4-hydroxybenzoate polyprenyltransferase
VEEAVKTSAPTSAPTPEAIAVPKGSSVVGAIKVLRPKQWTKNGLLFAALLFSGHFLEPRAISRSVLAAAAFCFLSSAGYVLNDYLDREADRNHPKKRLRPIASGALPEGAALAWMICILLAGAATALFLSPKFLAIALLYLATTVSYSLYFKHKVILDVMLLGACYVWRAVAGAVAIDVRVSPWLFLCTAFGALFLGFNKRRAELVQLGDKGGTRRNLREYSPQMLDQFQAIVTACTVLCYALYTVLGATTWMTLTIPFVLYGIFRYIYLVDQRGEGGAPDETFLKDKPILATVGLYAITAACVMYAHKVGWIA